MLEFISLLLIVIGGFIAGFYGSTVGGGAIVSFPILLLVGLPPQLALGTQFLGGLLLEFASAMRFHRAKKLRLKLAIMLGIIAGVGALIGGTIVMHINPKLLTVIFSIMLVTVPIILFNKEKITLKAEKLHTKHIILLFLGTFALGIYGGFFGAGFGLFITILFVLFGYSFIEGAAMGRVVGFCMMVFGTILFASHGLINYLYGIALGVGFASGSWIGIGFTLKKNESYIKSLIYFIVIISFIKIFFDIFHIKLL